MNMEKGLLLILYIVEVIKYYLAYTVIFGERLKRYLVSVVGGLVYLVALQIFSDSSRSFLTVQLYFIILCIVFIVQKGALLDRIHRLLVLFFILSCSDAFFARLLDLFMERGDANTSQDALLESLLTLLVMVLIYTVQRVNKKGRSEWFFTYLNKLIAPIIVMMSLAIVMTITGLDYASTYLGNQRFQVIVTVLCLFSYLGIEMLGIFIIYIRQANEKMEKLVEEELLVQEMQKRYYESLLKREEDTRRYRHDMSNHLLCLNQFAEESDLAALREYLGKMQRELQEIQRNGYDTGNQILNVITNYYIDMLLPLTEVNIVGRVQIQIDEMKLCTIYANLLQNAIEELKCCKEAAMLEIRFEQGTEFCKISIRNSLSGISRTKTEKQLFRTDKRDRKNHGLGLSNVGRAVESLNGTLELKKEGDCFLAVVVLPL